MTAEGAPDRQRIDTWLWVARFCRTRALAQATLADGKVRVRGRVLDKGDHVKAGDVLTLVVGSRLRTVEVLDLASRRGDAATARTLWRDLYDPV
ncbi:MAG: RNA-binding S4 domain-containing protein [Alphaproteobacteria bacterium]|nr:RNA-binding S4 domain-containing protein [Alphaproteobacteria bacterium]